MAINMSTVKQINYNNKEIKKIEMNGSVVWQKVEPKVLQSITLSGQTTSLNRNATFSFGGTVTAHYSDSTTANVTSSTTFSGYNMSTAGTYTVTATYTEDGITVTATYSLTVNKIWVTVWSGSRYCRGRVDASVSPAKTYTDGNGTVLYTVNTNNLPSPGSIQCRVTFSGMSGSGTTSYTPSNRTSPYTITGINSAKTIIQARGEHTSNSSYYGYARLRITRSGTTSSFNILCDYNSTTSGYQNYGGWFTVTKLELYY